MLDPEANHGCDVREGDPHDRLPDSGNFGRLRGGEDRPPPSGLGRLSRRRAWLGPLASPGARPFPPLPWPPRPPRVWPRLGTARRGLGRGLLRRWRRGAIRTAGLRLPLRARLRPWRDP